MIYKILSCVVLIVFTFNPFLSAIKSQLPLIQPRQSKNADMVWAYYEKDGEIYNVHIVGNTAGISPGQYLELITHQFPIKYIYIEKKGIPVSDDEAAEILIQTQTMFKLARFNAEHRSADYYLKSKYLMGEERKDFDEKLYKVYAPKFTYGWWRERLLYKGSFKWRPGLDSFSRREEIYTDVLLDAVIQSDFFIEESGGDKQPKDILNLIYKNSRAVREMSIIVKLINKGAAVGINLSEYREILELIQEEDEETAKQLGIHNYIDEFPEKTRGQKLSKLYPPQNGENLI